ncbi:MAG: NigD-like N-terminal domain-containing protein [Bacteroidaceae bacterium]|nr:NigD-like N-terminal domain-containing protein [Bacteroidaceae bacterium]
MIKKILMAGLVIASAAFQSCTKNDDGPSDVLAVVTVKNNEGKTFFQLDDEKTITPLNFSAETYKWKEVRAMCRLRDMKETNARTFSATVVAIDSMRTKNAVAYIPGTSLDKYGTDGIDIKATFATVLEDGYLTLHFGTYMAGTGITHEINLIEGAYTDEPSVVELRHNAHGDIPSVFGEGYIAFKLDKLANAKEIKIRYYSALYQRTIEYTLKRGESTNSNNFHE